MAIAARYSLLYWPEVRLFFKIQQGEFAVVFFCGFVVCLCGLDFVFEMSNMFSFTIYAYSCLPFLFTFIPGYTFVF